MRQWDAAIGLTGGVPTTISVTVETGSLEVESGQGGVTPLSPVDKPVIKRNATKSLGAKQHPQLLFTSTEIGLTDQLLTVTGDLTINGVTRQITVPLGLARGGSQISVSGSFSLRQTDYDVKPYSIMLGQVKVADEVTVEVDLSAAVPNS